MATVDPAVIERTNSLSGKDTAASHNGAQAAAHALRRPNSSDNIQGIVDESIYKVAEHKKEVRLGLRHRDSFAVHRGHGKGGAAPSSGAILAAWNKPPAHASAAGAGGAASGTASDDDDDDLGDLDDGEDTDVEVLEEGGPDAAAGAGAHPKKKNPLRSMAKGVGSFLGLRKSKKKRAAEVASHSGDAPGEVSSLRVVGATRGGIDNYPGQRRSSTISALVPAVAAAAAGGAPSTGQPKSARGVPGSPPIVPLASIAPGSPLLSGASPRTTTGRVQVVPAQPRPSGDAADGSPPKGSQSPRAPPPPGPPPAHRGSVAPPPGSSPRPSVVVAEGVAGSAVVPTMSSPPLSPPLSPLPPPGPPPPSAVLSGKASGGAPAPPRGASAGPAVPPARKLSGTAAAGSPAHGPAPAPLSPGMGGIADPISTTHRLPTPTHSILKTSASKRSGAAEGGDEDSAASSPARSASAIKRRISFADHHGHDLERVKFCDDLHYSENSDHSESEGWDEMGAAEEDKGNCAVM